LLAMAPAVFDRTLPAPDRPMYLSEITGANQARTLGRWGTSG
jgi:hypothetical protein